MVVKSFALDPRFDHVPDDTEETLVGSTLHQGAITVLASGLNLCGSRRGHPWLIGNQLKMIIPREGSRPSFMPSPDILVHPTLTNASRSSLLITSDGPPALIIEIASPSTALASDLNLTDERGKPSIYASIGVPEYLVFDPSTEFIPEQIWARRLGPNGYEPWLPRADGRWHSEALDISFAPHGFLLRVYDQDGNLVPTSEEMADLIEDTQRKLAERDRQIAELEARLRELRGE